MSDFNRVFLFGHLGNDPELKTSATGKAYLRLSLATHSYAGEGRKNTHWHRVIVFGSQAEVCAAYLRKGSPVLVEGSLEVSTFEDKDGEKSKRVSVVAQRVKFMGGKMGADTGKDPSDAVDEPAPEAAFAASA